MTGEEEAYVVALRRRRALADRMDVDHWDSEDAGARVAAARKALIELGCSREELRHLEECALPADEWIECMGSPMALGQLRRIATAPVKAAVAGNLDERKRGPVERLRQELEDWLLGGEE